MTPRDWLNPSPFIAEADEQRLRRLAARVTGHPRGAGFAMGDRGSAEVKVDNLPREFGRPEVLDPAVPVEACSWCRGTAREIPGHAEPVRPAPAGRVRFERKTFPGYRGVHCGWLLPVRGDGSSSLTGYRSGSGAAPARSASSISNRAAGSRRLSPKVACSWRMR